VCSGTTFVGRVREFGGLGGRPPRGPRGVGRFHRPARVLGAIVKRVARKEDVYSILKGQHSDHSTTRTCLLVWTSLGSPSQLRKRGETGSDIVKHKAVFTHGSGEVQLSTHRRWVLHTWFWGYRSRGACWPLGSGYRWLARNLRGSTATPRHTRFRSNRGRAWFRPCCSWQRGFMSQRRVWS